ncbi:MAG: hypothetical protein O2960_11805, partial [Verrucomicrobia bacterium]|nr:hypothetical protein [Verrucomicrobiota bacterium]
MLGSVHFRVVGGFTSQPDRGLSQAAAIPIELMHLLVSDARSIFRALRLVIPGELLGRNAAPGRIRVSAP